MSEDKRADPIAPDPTAPVGGSAPSLVPVGLTLPRIVAALLILLATFSFLNRYKIINEAGSGVVVINTWAGESKIIRSDNSYSWDNDLPTIFFHVHDIFVLIPVIGAIIGAVLFWEKRQRKIGSKIIGTATNR